MHASKLLQVEVEVEDQRPTAQRLQDALAALPPPTPSRVLQVSVLQGRKPLYCGWGTKYVHLAHQYLFRAQQYLSSDFDLKYTYDFFSAHA